MPQTKHIIQMHCKHLKTNLNIMHPKVVKENQGKTEENQNQENQENQEEDKTHENNL